MMRSAFAVTAVFATVAIRPAAAQQPSYDHHLLDTAEYFIANQALEGAYLNVAVARMVTPPSSTSRGDAQFLVLGSSAGFNSGQSVWTSHYWRTRPATVEEATVGRVVFCLDAAEGDVYRAPRDRSEALNAGWFMTTITDVSDTFRHEVRAGDYRLNLDCLRVAS